MAFFSQLRVCLVAVTTFALASCGQAPPSEDNIRAAISTFYPGSVNPGSQVSILRIGQQGKGDFDAPGSQDSYWPVEFKIRTKVVDLGPLQASTEVHAVAKIWRDKLGRWKAGDVEALR